jgi:hypothetical protein
MRPAKLLQAPDDQIVARSRYGHVGLSGNPLEELALVNRQKRDNPLIAQRLPG